MRAPTYVRLATFRVFLRQTRPVRWKAPFFGSAMNISKNISKKHERARKKIQSVIMKNEHGKHVQEIYHEKYAIKATRIIFTQSSHMEGCTEISLRAFFTFLHSKDRPFGERDSSRCKTAKQHATLSFVEI